MGDPARQTDVLGRKASAARRAFEARAMSPAKALRRALSRSADVLWDLALVTHGVGQEIADQDQVVEMLPPRGLLLLLDGPGGALGLGGPRLGSGRAAGAARGRPVAAARAD